MMEEGLGSDIGQVPELVERFTAAAKKATTIPVLAKLTPNVATMSPAAEAALRGGADGIAAINTIKSIMNVNPHTYISSPAVHGQSAVGGYSGNAVNSCADGGHQAIHLNEKRQPILDGKKCVGCHLCRLVCPTHSIASAKKRISRKH
jgi:NAD-dependent dihydropyrimidine dehydrogenase PreA subunit